jgi:hypothetical protein
MQHPVGYVINEAKGRAELIDIKAVLTKRLRSQHFSIQFHLLHLQQAR